MKFRIDFEERKVIQDLLDHGTEIKAIAGILERSQSAIYQEIKKNGGIRIYNAKIAQERSIKELKEGNKYKNSPIQHLQKRVLQLEICVKKLMVMCGIENEKLL